VQQVLGHPAYQAVCRHARMFSHGISARDVEEALLGNPSEFYGLDGLPARVEQIQTLLKDIRQNEEAWMAAAGSVFSRLLPGESLDITIYPIIGYDMGIGLDGVVCMNCNYAPYLADPDEFLLYIIHECVHVIYERGHTVPALEAVISPDEMRSYFNLWCQNEGFAVYAPLRLRQERGRLAERDYAVLFNDNQLEKHRKAFLETLDKIQQTRQLPLDEFLGYSFGPMRLTYRLGCELFRRIEMTFGLEAVREAFYLDGDSFMARYRHLLGDYN
jgi:hypothetical protein